MEIYNEAFKRLNFVAAAGTPAQIDAVTAYLQGEARSTRGVLTPSMEATLDLDPVAFLAFWEATLEAMEEEGEEDSEDWVIPRN